MDITTTLIKLALSDLKASGILYEQREFRTAYFMFQQAAEKANKAHALYLGVIKEKDLKDIGHNQFKADRKYAAEKVEELKMLLKDPKKISLKLEKNYLSFTKLISFIDGLKSQDLLHVSGTDLNSLYKELVVFRIPYDKRFPKIKELKKNKETKNTYSFGLSLLQWMQDFFFIKLVLSACALLTVQHSTLTRYPENGKDPFKIYTSKLPLIKKQALFMDLLEEAINKLKVHYTNPDFLKKVKRSMPV